MKALVVVGLMMMGVGAAAQSSYSLEVAGAWQTLNDQAVPGEGGTRFSLTDFGRGPFPLFRLYLGHRWNERHEIRALYAPLAIKLNGELSQTTDFAEETFAADTDTEAFYKFNSYRLSYIYHFDKQGEWDLAAGFTAKIRDAEVRLTQGNTVGRKTNVGFVPLLHLQGRRALSEAWSFRFDFDGLAAPQGRAFDIGAFLERSLPESSMTGFGGYRMIEGGADNREVYNFAWIHQAVLGLRGEF